MRRRGALPAIAAAVLIALALPGGAPAKDLGSAPKRPVTERSGIRLMTFSQLFALRARALYVHVKVTRPVALRFTGISLLRARGASPVSITRVRDVGVPSGRSYRVRLRLSRAGFRELLNCRRTYLIVRAVALVNLGGAPTRARTLSVRPLRLSRALCRFLAGVVGGEGPRGSRANPIDVETGSDFPRCDFIDRSVCLHPWPNDYYTVADGSMDSGRRVNLDIRSMPANRSGKPVDPAHYNRNDGASPGSMIITRAPGLESRTAFARSGLTPVTDMAQAFRPSQPLVVIDAATGARHLVWAEVDANPDDPADVTLIARPGTNFREGRRYIVALRNLRGEDGSPLAADPAFRIYRDRVFTTNPGIEGRRARFEDIFARLAAAGVDRDSLYIAWDFTVASERNLSERMLAIRDAAFAELGDTNLADLRVGGDAPGFEVTKVEGNPTGEIARRVHGNFTVPCYLNTPNCSSFGRFFFAPSSTTPQRIPGNVTRANFTCNIPNAAVNGGARPSLYGHGLLGSRGEINQSQLRSMAQEHNFVFCATDWDGMNCANVPTDAGDFEQIFIDALAGTPPNIPDCDIPAIATILADVSNFPFLVDRVQQGMLNFLFLGRLMIHPDGFNSAPEFNLGNGPVIDTRRLFYDGNSQGGIIGGALVAVAPDLNRGVLGVPGMNYSTLLRRSVDFGTGQPPSPDPTDPESVIPEYAYPLYQSYPNELERPLLLSLIQMLWDRGEANGYAHHMTSDPLPNTPPHEVLLHPGLGDHQVAQIAAEAEARTIGAATRRQYVDPGRSFDVTPGFGIPRIGSFPYAGSALIMWDTGPQRTEDGETRGTPPAPVTNTPPDAGEDPHEFPRRSVDARRQKSAFLSIGGRVIDVCGARPCYAGTWTGP